MNKVFQAYNQPAKYTKNFTFFSHDPSALDTVLIAPKICLVSLRECAQNALDFIQIGSLC